MDRTSPEEGAATDPGSSPTAPAPPVSQEEERGGPVRDRVKGARLTVGERKRSLLERAERERENHESVGALFHLIEQHRGRGGGLLAGGLAYRIFIWLLPAALMATSLLRLLADSRGISPGEAARRTGMGASLAATVNQAAAQAGRTTPILLGLGFVLMLWASRGVLKALRLVSAIAWGLRPAPLRSQIRATLATAGILTMLSIYAFVVAPLYGGSFASDVGATMLATIGIVAIATWATGALPHPDGVGGVDLIPGAILFAVGVEALRLASTVYFVGKLDRVDDLYGALGFAAVFMGYLYLLAQLAVLGLMTNAVLWHSGIPRGSVDETI